MKLIHFVLLLFAIALCVSKADAQWVQTGLSDRVIGHIAFGSSGLYAVTSDSGSVYRSTDGGGNWRQIVQSGAYVISGPAHWTVGRVAVAPNGEVYMAKMGWAQDSLYRSSDGGNIWSNITPSIAGWGMNVAVAPTGTVYCGFYGAGGVTSWYHTWFAKSTDAGLSWQFHDTGPDSLGGVAFAFNGHRVMTSGWWYAVLPKTQGTAQDSIHNHYISISSDDGETWIYRYSFYAEVFAFCANGNVIAGRWGGGGALSGDSGGSWKSISSISPSVFLALPQGGVLVGNDTTGIYLFSDNGDSIKMLKEGLTDLHVHTLAMDGTSYAYVGTNKGVWRRPLSQVVAASQPPEFPIAFRLDQNYPNPFNPSTTIRYELPNSSIVRLSVYDMLGREVLVLVNERKEAGSYVVNCDASNFSSGVYFNRLQAGHYVQMRKMIVLK